MQSGSRVRVLVADDHTLVRDGLMRLIRDQPDMVVVGEARHSDEAIAEAQRVTPDVMLLDVSMPGAGGVSVAQVLATVCPGVRIIAVTRHTDQVFVANMLRAGAAGYVLKQSSPAELLRAIRSVAAGERHVDKALRLSPAAAASAASGVSGTFGADVSAVSAVNGAPPSTPVAEGSLSPVEEEVLHLVARAHSNHEIAEQLQLESDDVATIKAAAMRKAGLKTRLDAIGYADRRGWS